MNIVQCTSHTAHIKCVKYKLNDFNSMEHRFHILPAFLWLSLYSASEISLVSLYFSLAPSFSVAFRKRKKVNDKFYMQRSIHTRVHTNKQVVYFTLSPSPVLRFKIKYFNYCSLTYSESEQKTLCNTTKPETKTKRDESGDGKFFGFKYK